MGRNKSGPWSHSSATVAARCSRHALSRARDGRGHGRGAETRRGGRGRHHRTVLRLDCTHRRRSRARIAREHRSPRASCGDGGALRFHARLDAGSAALARSIRCPQVAARLEVFDLVGNDRAPDGGRDWASSVTRAIQIEDASNRRRVIGEFMQSFTVKNMMVITHLCKAVRGSHASAWMLSTAAGDGACCDDTCREL